MQKICPKCDSPKTKMWIELSDDEKHIFKILSVKFTSEQRKSHRFCLRCNHEWSERQATV